MISRIVPSVLYGFIWKGWQIAAAPVTLLLIVRFFSPELQGYFYTFGSLLALQSFFELGFYIVVINVAAHEWAELTIDASGRIAGSSEARDRLVSLGRIVFGWYAAASAIFFVVALLAGFWLFVRESAPVEVWRGPWIAVVALTSLNLWAAPFSALLEGCDQVAQVHRINALQAVLASVGGWAVIALGGGLWTAVAIAAAQLFAVLYLLLVQYRRFFAGFLRPPQGAAIAWRTEVWPMQWRLALSGLVSYLAFSLYTPVMFRYHGPEIAGQMGMTLQIVSGIMAAALIWLKTSIPSFGVFVARRDFDALNRTWARSTLRSLSTFLVLAVGFYGTFVLLRAMGYEIATRILPLELVVLLLIGGALMTVAQGLTAYLRAHKEEPILVMSVTTSLATGAFVWLLGRSYGATGASWTYLAAMAVILVWDAMIWRRYRRERHVPEPALAVAR